MHKKDFEFLRILLSFPEGISATEFSILYEKRTHYRQTSWSRMVKSFMTRKCIETKKVNKYTKYFLTEDGRELISRQELEDDDTPVIICPHCKTKFDCPQAAVFSLNPCGVRDICSVKKKDGE